MHSGEMIPLERIERSILVIRQQRVILDVDLAKLYGVSTGSLNQQIVRNLDRFPADFMFQLTLEEKGDVIASCPSLRAVKFSRALPRAFTEHGALMVASVLNSPRAVQVSLFVVRAFVRLRAALIAQKEVAAKLDELEGRCDARHRSVLDALRRLLTPPEEPKKAPIGFKPKR